MDVFGKSSNCKPKHGGIVVGSSVGHSFHLLILVQLATCAYRAMVMTFAKRSDVPNFPDMPE
jgi:hypothetical protein